MGINAFSSSFCSLAGSISLLMFAGTAFAASVDTKAPAKMTSAPVPTVKAPVVSVPAPTVQPKVQIQTPTQSIQPKTSVKVPPPSTNRPQPKQVHQAPVKPMVTIQTPTHKVQTLDPRYAPKMPPAPSATTPRPGQNPIAPAATPTSPTTNALGGSKIDRQTLERIQGIQEAATAAQVFKQLEELRNAKDLQNIGAAKRGFGGDQAGPLGDGGIGIGAVSGEGSNGPGSPGSKPGMGAIDRSSSADPAAGYRSGSQGGSSLGTNKASDGHILSQQYSRDSNSGSVSFRYRHNDGSTSSYKSSAVSNGRGGSIRTVQIITTNKKGETFRRDITNEINENGEVINNEDTETGALTEEQIEELESARVEASNPEGGTGGSDEPSGETQGGQSSEVDQGDGDSCGRRDVMTGKCYDSKPTMQQMTGQKARDGGGEGTSAPIIGPTAVTNEDEFHSGGGGGGGRRVNKDMLTQPPTEGAEGGGSTPPPPTPGGAASLEEVLGDAALH